LLAFGLAVSAVFVSDSRGPMLTMGVLLGFYVLFGMGWCTLPKRLAVCVVALLMLCAMTLQSDRMMSRLQDTVQATVQSIPAMLQGQEPVGGDASTRSRLGMWKAS